MLPHNWLVKQGWLIFSVDRDVEEYEQPKKVAVLTPLSPSGVSALIRASTFSELGSLLHDGNNETVSDNPLLRHAMVASQGYVGFTEESLISELDYLRLQGHATLSSRINDTNVLLDHLSTLPDNCKNCDFCASCRILIHATPLAAELEKEKHRTVRLMHAMEQAGVDNTEQLYNQLGRPSAANQYGFLARWGKLIAARPEYNPFVWKDSYLTYWDHVLTAEAALLG